MANNQNACCVISINEHHDRITLVKLQASPVDLVVIKVYMPTSDYDFRQQKMKNYAEIEELLRLETRNVFNVVMGDFSAVIGGKMKKQLENTDQEQKLT